MSSPASDRKTSRPFATLSSDSARRTGPRAKLPEPTPPIEAPTPEIEPPTDALPDAARAERLRKPYASLMPRAPGSTPTEAPESLIDSDSNQPAAPSIPPPSGVAAAHASRASASIVPGSSSASPSPARTSARPAQPNAGQCKKHRIQRNRAGVCLLCKKEAAANSNGLSWKLLLVAAFALALLASVALALL